MVVMKSSKRPHWDHFWFTLALIYSTRGTCDRLRTACLIVKNNRLVGAGYNGSPRGMPHCDDVGHLIIDGHCERTLHGEENAIQNTERRNLDGGIAYVVATPCIRCFRALINVGILEVHYIGTYDNANRGKHIAQLAKQSKVKLVAHALDPAKLLEESILRLKGPGGALFV